MDWSVQFLSTVHVPQDERSPGSSPARHSEVLANEIATSRAVRWSTYKARSRCHACFEPDHRPGGEDRPYRLGSRLRWCLDGGHAQRSRVLRLRRGSGEFRSGRYSADVGCQAAARSPSDWFGWFRQNGGLALRPKAMLGKQTLCQLSYSRSEQRDLYQIELRVRWGRHPIADMTRSGVSRKQVTITRSSLAGLAS